MASLRPHRHFNFVGLWKKGFILSGILIVLSIAGLLASFAMTGSPVTLGTEFSGGTSIQLTDTGDITEDQVKEAFEAAAQETGHETTISSIQTSSSANTGNGFIIRTADTVSADITDIMVNVEEQLGVSEANVQIETIGASWGASVIWRSFLAFIISCLAILVVIAARYREPRMGVVALITLFHDLLIVVGIYAWAGIFFHMEVTSDVIAALLAIIGYSLYDTIVSFHRINQNASPAMRMSLKTCANISVNQICMRSLNTSITSILPVLLMLILGTDTLKDFAFAMFCGMVIGIYSTFAISTPVYTMWKIRDPQYKRLEDKYPYEVIQSPFTKEMMLEARKASKEAQKAAKAQQAVQAAAAVAETAAAVTAATAAAGTAAAAAAAPAQQASQAAAEQAQEAKEAQQAAADEPAPADEPLVLEVDAEGNVEEPEELQEVEIELTSEMLAKLGIEELPESGELELTAEQLAMLGIELDGDDDEPAFELELTEEQLAKLGIESLEDGMELELTPEMLEELGIEVEYEEDAEEE
ncbi:MAG: protein translocase subunit SecF [Coriobacteriales bacterium]